MPLSNTPIESFLQALRFYRKLDFFNQYQSFSDEQLMVRLDEKTGNLYFNHVWDELCGNNRCCDLALLQLDMDRVFDFDLEMNPSENNNELENLIEKMIKISRGKFLPQNMRVSYKVEASNSDEMLFNLSFDLYDEQQLVSFTYINGWFKLSNFEIINKIIAQTGYRYEVFDTQDQYSIVVMLQEREKISMEQERGLVFTNLLSA